MALLLIRRRHGLPASQHPRAQAAEHADPSNVLFFKVPWTPRPPRQLVPPECSLFSQDRRMTHDYQNLYQCFLDGGSVVINHW